MVILGLEILQYYTQWAHSADADEVAYDELP